ncbi:MAG: glycine cleavage system aminomethyltransferase GcvT, partial [Clostridiales bacterium]|nr:glycine cleavage system aminomethyltransferase GcvT [Clostridiales bacterium]
MEKKTPLYDVHVGLGGKMVPYAGYLMPVQYKSGVIQEHLAVRESCGLFDVSHMGELILEGADALKNLQYLLTNDMSGMKAGQARYSPMCNMQGGIVDDLLVYYLGEDKYLLVVNAANKDKDVAWIEKNLLGGEVSFSDDSDQWGQIALQGPRAQEILEKIVEDRNQIPEKYYRFNEQVVVAGCECLLSRTGYTGEDGFELYCKKEDTVSLWNSLLQAGKEEGLIPCGLGARDTLRLEAGMPLYGQEMTDELSPIESGIGFFVKVNKEDFIGKKAILERKEQSLRNRVGFEITSRGIAREGNKVFAKGEKIGTVTSGTFSPYFNKAIGMAVLEKEIDMDSVIEIDVRGRKVEGKIVKLPFYKV